MIESVKSNVEMDCPNDFKCLNNNKYIGSVGHIEHRHTTINSAKTAFDAPKSNPFSEKDEWFDDQIIQTEKNLNSNVISKSNKICQSTIKYPSNIRFFHQNAQSVKF